MELEIIRSNIEAFVRKAYNGADDALIYHNIGHTENVVEAAKKIAAHYNLSEEECFITEVAAWFHDVGYITSPLKNHEIKSCEIAEAELQQYAVPEPVIEKIKGCIMATRMPQEPHNLLEQILADADLWYIGTDAYMSNQKLLKQEIALLQAKEFSKPEWRQININLLSTHRFHTDFARQVLTAKQQANLKRQQEKKEAKAAEKEKEQAEKSQKNNPPTRGIETMFRVTMANQMELSSMADAKANIMISVNSITVSVVLSVLLRRLEEFPNLIIPTIILLTVNVCTIVFSILAVRPKINKGAIKPNDIREKKVNLLFFGNYQNMSLEDYNWGMKEMMKDRDYLYGNMMKHIFDVGVILGKKYNWLRIAYTIFMYGFITAIISYIVAMFF